MTIKRRERDAILQSLQAGLVPKIGLHLIQVGRKQEVNAVLGDIDRIADGGAAFRIIEGNYGSGKSSFLNLVKSLALQKNLLVLQVDITMERRVYSKGGEAQALFSELVRNLATKARPEGDGLIGLIESWVGTIQLQVKSAGGSDDAVKAKILTSLSSVHSLTGGFDFSEVLAKYYEGYSKGDDGLKAAAVKWLRAEYATKTEARQALGVRTILGDSLYENLKLVAAFAVLAGNAGILVNIDELVVLSHRLPNRLVRQANFEAILAIINDCLQGGASHLGFIFAGTVECVEDTRRGLFSYEALRSRLASNSLAQGGLVDLSGPVIKLKTLTPERLSEKSIWLGKRQMSQREHETAK
ncbi:MAG: ATP-binding protein [Verrucomicrobiota bacterium]